MFFVNQFLIKENGIIFYLSLNFNIRCQEFVILIKIITKFIKGLKHDFDIMKVY